MFYIMVNGELVQASLADIEDKTVVLYDEDGNVVREAEEAETEIEEEEEEEEEGKEGEVTIEKQLADTLDKLNGAIAGFGEKFKSQEKEIKNLKTNMQKGFPIHNPGAAQHTDNDNEIMKFLGEQWDRKHQGRGFDDISRKWGIPEYPNKNNEEVIDELYKYFGLVTLASKYRPDSQSIKAMDLFKKHYGSVKTTIGDTGNQFPIPDIVHAEIIWFARERSYALAMATVVPMTSEKDSWPRETGSATIQWGNTTQKSDPTVDEVELDAEELSCYTAVKNAHMADSRSDIVAWLTANLGEAAGLELDNKMFNGAGTDDPFICSGLLTAHCGNSVVMATGSTAFSQLTESHFSEMIAALDGVRKQGARFMMNGAILHFVRTLKDSNGQPIFFPGSIGTGVPPTIFGYPYDEVIKMPSTSASNTAFIVFGNPAYFYVGRRLDTATLDVNPYLLWTTNRTAYKLYQRWALVQALPAAFVRLLTAS